MVNIVREVFSLFGTDVVKASYKNSVYYIVGTNDITDYVSKIKDSFDLEELDAIKYGFDAFLKDNPVSTLKVPQFELVILDNATTSASYVEQIVADIFRKDYEETHNIVNAIHHEGSAVVAKGTMELMHTFACMVETANVATGNELETDMIEIYESESMDSMELLENLIRRDFPGDI